MERIPCPDPINQWIEWFDRKAVRAKRWNYANRILIVVLTSAIALLGAGSSLVDEPSLRTIALVTALLGALVTVLEVIAGFMHYNDLYGLYREACEKLIEEKTRYEYRIAPYNQMRQQDNTARFMERCITIRRETNNSWNKTVLSLQRRNQTSS